MYAKQLSVYGGQYGNSDALMRRSRSHRQAAQNWSMLSLHVLNVQKKPAKFVEFRQYSLNSYQKCDFLAVAAFVRSVVDTEISKG